MKYSSDEWLRLRAGLVFLAFLAYYLTTAYLLPYGAGPDYSAHYDGAKFLFAHERLAVLPDDASALQFTPYGSTRALRPPLAYIAAAGVAKALSWTSIDLKILFRAGSALFGALTVWLAFLTIARFSKSQSSALVGALAIGLLPQFTFITSHLNDDSAAILSVTFLIYCLSRTLEGRAPGSLALMTGLAFGLVLISKFTAWLFLPTAGLIMLLFARPERGQWLKGIAGFSAGVLIGGGWWIAFNIWHYGWSDPLLFKISSEISQQFGRIKPEDVKGFAASGISFSELILGDYKNFIDETLAATIGNLDWLRLRVGAPQYSVYLLVLMIAIGYLLARWLMAIGSWISGRGINEPQRLGFESLLFGAVVFQFLIYAYYQWQQEVQVQGKYLLPVLLIVVMLFISAMQAIGRHRWIHQNLPVLSFGSHSVGRRISVFPILAVVILISVHVDALTRFVVPFYSPPAQILGLGRFESLNLADRNIVSTTRNLTLNVIEEGWEIHATSRDPQIEFHPAVCNSFTANNLMAISIKSDTDGLMQLFWSDGRGFAARQGESSMAVRFLAGEQRILLAVGNGPCKQLRLDPTNQMNSTILIRSIEIAPLSIRRRPFYLRIFKSLSTND